MQEVSSTDSTPTLLLNSRDVASLVSWDELIEAARRALVEIAGEQTATSAQLTMPGALLHLKAGFLTSPPLLSVKANLRPVGRNATGAILVFDVAAGRLHAVVASADVTSMRTAAVAAVAADHLLASRPAVTAILGAGPVAQRVAEVLAHRGLASEFRWWSRSVATAEAAAAKAPSGIGATVCDTVRSAVATASLVVTCTPTQRPILDIQDLSDDVLILAMGADSPGKRELSDGAFGGVSRVYADAPDAARLVGECAALSADAQGPVALGASLAAAPRADTVTGRTIFDSVGSAVVDAAVAGLLVDNAAARGVGQPIEL
jgi:ornithine cyclodeaminase/alanine dehydrogenase-like protein (mu-crystallin family)